jgi:competence protein ComEC
MKRLKIRNALFFFLSDILFVSALALLVAYLLALYGNFSLLWGYGFLVVGTLFLGAFWEQKKIALVGIFFLFLGSFLFFAQERIDLSWTQDFVGQSFSGEVRVLSEGVKESYTQRIPILFPVCEDGICEKRRAFLRTNLFEDYVVGESVRVKCEWEVPEYDEKTQTNWMAIFASQGSPLFCKDEHPQKTGEVIKDWRYTFSQIRGSFESHIEQSIPYPESALGAGLLFGGTSRFSDEWEEKFAQTSMTHIVAVSGYNVTLLVQYLGFLAVLLGFRRKHSWVVGVVGIVFFIALIGFPSSGVRAGIMGVLTLIALNGGAMHSGVRALIIASACMVLWNPFLLRYDVGFQLSFLATLGILLGSPFMAKLSLHRLTLPLRILCEIALVTFFAQLFVLPIIIITFGSFSVLSFLANLLILWNIPFAMLGVGLALLASFFSLMLGQIVGFFAWGVLSYDLWVIDTLASYEFGLFRGSVPVWIFGVYGGVLLGFFVWYYDRERRKKIQRCEALSQKL